MEFVPDRRGLNVSPFPLSSVDHLNINSHVIPYEFQNPWLADILMPAHGWKTKVPRLILEVLPLASRLLATAPTRPQFLPNREGDARIYDLAPPLQSSEGLLMRHMHHGHGHMELI